jgi:hypothetical protein
MPGVRLRLRSWSREAVPDWAEHKHAVLLSIVILNCCSP